MLGGGEGGAPQRRWEGGGRFFHWESQKGGLAGWVGGGARGREGQFAGIRGRGAKYFFSGPKIRPTKLFSWGIIHRKSPQKVNDYGDSKVLRRSIFSTAGSLVSMSWFGRILPRNFHGFTIPRGPLVQSPNTPKSKGNTKKISKKKKKKKKTKSPDPRMAPENTSSIRPPKHMKMVIFEAIFVFFVIFRIFGGQSGRWGISYFLGFFFVFHVDLGVLGSVRESQSWVYWYRGAELERFWPIWGGTSPSFFNDSRPGWNAKSHKNPRTYSTIGAKIVTLQNSIFSN